MTTKGSVFGKRMPGAGHLDRTTKSVVPVEKELLVLGQQRRWGWDVDTILWSLLVPSSDCSLAAPVGLFHSPLPWHADLHLFVVTEQDLYSLKDALVALCIPTSWLSHPGLTVPFHILSCRSQAISWHAVVELCLNPPCGLVYILVYVLAWSCALTQMLYISHFQRLILSQAEGSKHPSPLRLMNLVPALIITVNGLAKDCLLKHQKTTVRAFCLHFQ